MDNKQYHNVKNNNEEEKDINNYIDINNKQIYKPEFNFDILNEPMPDFTEQKDKYNFILNTHNYAYKRKYNEIQNEKEIFPGKSLLKIKSI